MAMASNFSTVKLNAELIDAARREADLFNRSLGGQIEHWARLGWAMENAAGVSLDRVREALAGELRLETLSRSEQEQFFDLLGDRFLNPPEAVRAAYRTLGDAPGAVGDDSDGILVERMQDRNLRPLP
jgi:hypothetical protein